MRIVATHAPVIGLFAVPIPGPPAVNAVSPVPVFGPVAFAAEKVGMLEIELACRHSAAKDSCDCQG